MRFNGVWVQGLGFRVQGWDPSRERSTQKKNALNFFNSYLPMGSGLRFGVWSLDFGAWCLGLWAWGLGFGVWVLGFGFWVPGFGFWVLDFGFWGQGQGFGVRVWGPGSEFGVRGLQGYLAYRKTPAPLGP